MTCPAIEADWEVKVFALTFPLIDADAAEISLTSLILFPPSKRLVCILFRSAFAVTTRDSFESSAGSEPGTPIVVLIRYVDVLTMLVPGSMLESTPSQSWATSWSTLNVKAVHEVDTALLYLLTERLPGMRGGTLSCSAWIACKHVAPPGQEPFRARYVLAASITA
ncbi:hypothetical protein D3C81_1227130 [compost metagenome]